MADLSLIKFCISEDLSTIGIEEAKIEIKKSGGIIREGITNDVWYYITNNPNQKNEDTLRAKELGVTFLSESDLLKMLEVKKINKIYE